MCLCLVYVLATLFIVNIQYSAQDCLLPQPPAHGRYQAVEFQCAPGAASPECRGVAGTRVPDTWLLTLTCDVNYVPADDATIVCQKDKWVPPPAGCVYKKTSITNTTTKPSGGSRPNPSVPTRPVISTPSGESGCVLPKLPTHGSYNGLFCESQQPGSMVTSQCILLFSCLPGYEFSGRSDKEVSLLCNSDGKWSPQPAELSCQPGSHQHLPSQPVTRPSNKNRNCVLPQIAEGRIVYSQCIDQSQGIWCRPPLGSTVSGITNITCEEGYGLSPIYSSQVSTCTSAGKWSPEIPKCRKLCPPLESVSTSARCSYRNTRVDCSMPLLPETALWPVCKKGYTEYPELAANGRYKTQMYCQENGRWSYPSYLPECKRECGVSKGDDIVTSVIVDGVDTKLGQFPWHAGIYWLQFNTNSKKEEWQNKCGGSLITNQVVLTAAHCVEDQERQPQPAGRVSVALAKYYRSWAHDETFAIKRQVQRIEKPQDYEGSVRNFAWDIALLFLDQLVESTNFVMPVCLNIPEGYEVTESATAYVAGWGTTKEVPGFESETLLSSTIEVVPYDKCRAHVSSWQFVPQGKFCGIRRSAGASVVQKGDSGGGLTVVIDGLHYIAGIVSSRQNYTSIFTNTSYVYHKDWIYHNIINYL